MEKEIECPECEGKGFIEDTCGNCNGSGEGIADGTTCKACKGSGIERYTCQDCDEGYIEVCENCNLPEDDCTCVWEKGGDE